MKLIRWFSTVILSVLFSFCDCSAIMIYTMPNTPMHVGCVAFTQFLFSSFIHAPKHVKNILSHSVFDFSSKSSTFFNSKLWKLNTLGNNVCNVCHSSMRATFIEKTKINEIVIRLHFVQIFILSKIVLPQYKSQRE